MALSKLKASAKTQAVRKFTDREAPIEAFGHALRRYLSNDRRLQVLTYYGVGGIGKTSLLRHLQGEAADSSIERVSIGLESPQYASPADCLLAIRQQLRAPCPSFEYALARFYAINGRSLRDITRDAVDRDSLLFDLAEMAADLAEVVAPARLVKRLWDLGDEKLRRYIGSFRNLFEEIDQLADEDVGPRLPYYLGLELERHVHTSGAKLVFFIDTHEAMLDRERFRSTKQGGDEWLKELIGCTENGLYVIAGREYLKWADENPEWSPHIEQHALGELSDTDADYFLSLIPVREAGIRKAIIDTAHGVPLYLDLCASIYLIKKANGERLRQQDFRLAENEVIRRFLAHLDPEQEQALRAACVPEIFDYTLFGALLRDLNIGFPLTLFGEFCSTSYTECVQTDPELYKIHNSVRAHICDEADAATARQIFGTIVRHCRDCSAPASLDRTAWVYDQALVVLALFDLTPGPDEVDTLLRTGVVLIDAGHWNDVHASLARIGRKTADGGTDHFHTAIRFLEAYCQRKRGALREARDTYEHALAGAHLLGAYGDLLRFHAAHTAHLLGRYDEALGTYQALAGGVDGPQGAAGPAAQLARRQGADVRMLQGRFREALDDFRELVADRPNDPLWQAELLRFQGHTLRFNFFLAEAGSLYEEALAISESAKADSMRGKAITNLAETTCWTAPHTALRYAEEAVALNREVHAPIEMGKALAAKAIAEAMIHRSAEPACATARDAAALQERNGYRAGVLFALQAQGLAELLAGDRQACAATLERMTAICEELTVYRFLPFVLRAVLAPETAADEYAWVQWLDCEETITAIQAILRTPGA